MGKASLSYFIFLTLLLTYIQFQVKAAPSGPLVKHLSSIIKWSRSSSRTPQSDGNVIQFEDGYIVETVVEGNDLGFVPHSIRVSQDGELFAVDSINSNVVRITPPLSQYSRGRLVAGSFQGKTGHIDGKPSDARFSNPKGVTMDDQGNVYVADTSNLAIRKIGEAGVTTIAGGKSNIPGYRDGPSDEAKFSSDFDVIFVQPTCSLLVIDRGNAALRKISLNNEDCNYENSSVSSTDIYMVFGAIFVGYATCMLQQGFGSSFFSKMLQQRNIKALYKHQEPKQSPGPNPSPVKPEQETNWPSFSQLVTDLSKFAFESITNFLISFIPYKLRQKVGPTTKGLTPGKDGLIMPEDKIEPPVLAQKTRTPAILTETKVNELRTHKIRSSSMKDPSLSTKHRSSRRQEYAEFYGSSEGPNLNVPVRSKSQKDRSKHRREVVGEVKPVENKTVNYDDVKFDHYNMRNKYGDW